MRVRTPRKEALRLACLRYLTPPRKPSPAHAAPMRQQCINISGLENKAHVQRAQAYPPSQTKEPMYTKDSRPHPHPLSASHFALLLTTAAFYFHPKASISPSLHEVENGYPYRQDLTLVLSADQGGTALAAAGHTVARRAILYVLHQRHRCQHGLHAYRDHGRVGKDL